MCIDICMYTYTYRLLEYFSLFLNASFKSLNGVRRVLDLLILAPMECVCMGVCMCVFVCLHTCVYIYVCVYVCEY
jgi:hypothetical protein